MPGQNGEPLNFFHFDQKKGGGSSGNGWYEQKGYAGDKDRRGFLAKVLACFKSVPLPPMKVVFVLSFIAACAYGSVAMYRHLVKRAELAPKAWLYLNNGCRGDNIPLTLHEGMDLRQQRSTGRGYKLCEMSFPHDLNANDAVRSIRVQKGFEVFLYEHCTGPFKTMVTDSKGARRNAGPFQPLSEAVKGGRFFSACTDLTGRQIQASYVHLL